LIFEFLENEFQEDNLYQNGPRAPKSQAPEVANDFDTKWMSGQYNFNDKTSE
jgi:hypothetical protein